MEKTKKNKSGMPLGERMLRLLTDEQTGAAIILAVVVLILAFTADNFLSTRNLTNLLRYASFYVMVGVGVLVIFRSGAMDLSLARRWACPASWRPCWLSGGCRSGSS